MTLNDTPENWSIQVHLFVYANNTQTISNLHVPPYEIVFIRNGLFD